MESSNWNGLFKVGGATALMVVLTVLLDSITGFLATPTAPGTTTVAEWFALFADDPFLGLANLGLFNMLYYVFTVPVFLAFYITHKSAHPAGAALTTLFWFVGVTIYLTTNTALPMLALSGEYAAAAAESQRSLLLAAGEAVLARGEDLTASTFIGIAIPELATIGMSVVMFRSRIFSRVTAVAGMLAFGFLLGFNILAAFAPALFSLAMAFATAGGLCVMCWYVLVARRLFQLGRRPEAAALPPREALPAVAR